jgi:hypothetical protein
LKKLYLILFLFAGSFVYPGASFANPLESSTVRFDFYGETIEFAFSSSNFVDYNQPLSQASIASFYQSLTAADYSSVLTVLLAYKEKYKADDWLYYQLVRKTAQQISPKAANYNRYTLYKWFLLNSSGYDAILTFAKDQLLFYVQCNENIYNIPSRIKNGNQYVCLNYHDFGLVNFEAADFDEIAISFPEPMKGFSYKITRLPDFKEDDYIEKDIQFPFYQSNYRLTIKLTPQVKTIFANYPVVDYESYFNIPLSATTYASLIPSLKKNLKGMSVKSGVDYLMRFTRYAFLFEADSISFGNEKRLSPEQTLLYEKSDCDDRAALFFYLVKEVYNLPMIVLAYPQHVTVAVKFDKAIGKAIVYNGESYSICEPTPQKQDLFIGQSIPELSKTHYEVAYAYTPVKK